MLKKILISLVAVAISTTVLFANGSSETTKEANNLEKVYTMQIGHAQPMGNPRHISLEHFKKIVEEKTNGGIKVELYPAGQLGTEKEMLEQTCGGVIQAFRGGQFDFLPKFINFYFTIFMWNTRASNSINELWFALDVL